MTGKYLDCLSGANKPPQGQIAALVHSSLATLVFRSQQEQCTQIYSIGEDHFVLQLAMGKCRLHKDQTPRGDNVTFRILRWRKYLEMHVYAASLYIIPCIKTSHCIRGPNNCISEKKVKLAYLLLKKSAHLQQQLTSKCVIYHTICHTEARKKNHNWSFYLFHYFLPQPSVNKIKMPFWVT